MSTFLINIDRPFQLDFVTDRDPIDTGERDGGFDLPGDLDDVFVQPGEGKAKFLVEAQGRGIVVGGYQIYSPALNFFGRLDHSGEQGSANPQPGPVCVEGENFDFVAIHPVSYQANHLGIDPGGKTFMLVWKIDGSTQDDKICSPERFCPVFDPGSIRRCKGLDSKGFFGQVSSCRSIYKSVDPFLGFVGIGYWKQY